MSFTRDTLHLSLRPAWSHSALLLAVHLIALAAVVVSPVWSVAQTAVLLLAILASGAYRVYRFGLLRHPASILEVNYDRGSWQLRLRTGKVLDATLLSPVVISPWFMVLHFKAMPSLARAPASRSFIKSSSRLFIKSSSRLFFKSRSRLFFKSRSRLSVVIANDSLDQDTLRRSRVLFRFGLAE